MTPPYERLAQALADKLAAEGVVVSPDLLKTLLWDACGVSHTMVKEDY